MPLRAVFLDVGDTLLTSRPSRAAIYRDVAAGEGLAVDEAGMAALMRGVHGELPLEIEGSYRYSDLWFARYIRRIFRDRLGLSEARVPAVTETLFDAFEQPDNFELFPGVEELLVDLRAAGLVLGVVSNWSARLPRLLENLGLYERFDFVLSSAIERAEKPDPALFQRALEHAGVEPHQALHAGDHPEKDCAGALALGIGAVLVAHPGSRCPVEARTSEDWHCVGGLAELRSYILGLRS